MLKSFSVPCLFFAERRTLLNDFPLSVEYERKCSEFGDDADFSPYYGKGIVAIDACTVRSKQINCIVIEE